MKLNCMACDKEVEVDEIWLDTHSVYQGGMTYEPTVSCDEHKELTWKEQWEIRRFNSRCGNAFGGTFLLKLKLP